MEGSSFSLAPEPEGAEDHLSPLMVCNHPPAGGGLERWPLAGWRCLVPPSWGSGSYDGDRQRC